MGNWVSISHRAKFGDVDEVSGFLWPFNHQSIISQSSVALASFEGRFSFGGRGEEGWGEGRGLQSFLLGSSFFSGMLTSEVLLWFMNEFNLFLNSLGLWPLVYPFNSMTGCLFTFDLIIYSLVDGMSTWLWHTAYSCHYSVNQLATIGCESWWSTPHHLAV